MNKSLVICFMLIVLLLPSLATLGENSWTADLKADQPGTVRFFGSEIADLFTKEISESCHGVLKYNFVSKDDGKYPAGFLHASPPGQGWSGTFWTRDGGTFMRELVQWGYYEHACLVSDCLMRLVGKNEEGYYAFPEFFEPGVQKAGMELDGTTSIIIGMVLLWQRLPEKHPFRQRIYDFLHQDASPVNYIRKRLEMGPLIAGTGEFGPGCGLPGAYCNSVQNNLAMLSLLAAADMEETAGARETARRCREDARKIRDNMEKYLVDSGGAWHWCIDPKTMKPDPRVESWEINRGFGGRNGVACMYSDVLGFEPQKSSWRGIEHNRRTFYKLYSWPLRREQFNKYGIWTQFDDYRLGLGSAPSYGDGYALQTMLLYDRLDMADRSLKWMAESTFKAEGVVFETGRLSPYYFYERTYSPDAIGKMHLTAGCGPLNLVNVTEPLKVARLVLGVDDTSAKEVRIIPRVPPSWQGVEASNWPIRTSKGVVRAHILYTKKNGKAALILKLNPGQSIPRLAVRMPSEKGWIWYRLQNVTTINL